MPQNSLTKPADTVVEYESNGERVKLSPSTVQKFLVNGGGSVTAQEVVMFLNLCKFQHLNPFLREAYLIKFGNSPATIVTGKEVFTKRARRNKDYQGFEAGILVKTDDGAVERRTGTFRLPDETLVGGWAKVYIEGYAAPVEAAVSLEEYIGRKADGTVNGQWQKKPATMIRKVALVQALREAFPEDFQGLYTREEVADATRAELPEEPLPIPSEESHAPEEPAGGDDPFDA